MYSIRNFQWQRCKAVQMISSNGDRFSGDKLERIVEIFSRSEKLFTLRQYLCGDVCLCRHINTPLWQNGAVYVSIQNGCEDSRKPWHGVMIFCKSYVTGGSANFIKVWRPRDWKMRWVRGHLLSRKSRTVAERCFSTFRIRHSVGIVSVDGELAAIVIYINTRGLLWI